MSCVCSADTTAIPEGSEEATEIGMKAPTLPLHLDLGEVALEFKFRKATWAAKIAPMSRLGVDHALVTGQFMASSLTVYHQDGSHMTAVNWVELVRGAKVEKWRNRCTWFGPDGIRHPLDDADEFSALILIIPVIPEDPATGHEMDSADTGDVQPVATVPVGSVIPLASRVVGALDSSDVPDIRVAFGTHDSDHTGINPEFTPLFDFLLSSPVEATNMIKAVEQGMNSFP